MGYLILIIHNNIILVMDMIIIFINIFYVNVIFCADVIVTIMLPSVYLENNPALSHVCIIGATVMFNIFFSTTYSIIVTLFSVILMLWLVTLKYEKTMSNFNYRIFMDTIPASICASTLLMYMCAIADIIVGK
jgi:hypothetical protein